MKRTKFSNPTKSYSIEELKAQLSEEWNKPKQNIKKTRENARSHKKIRMLQKQIAELKKKPQ